ncbi:M1 family peptidase, partial [Streptomyces sp. NPDC059627]
MQGASRRTAVLRREAVLATVPVAVAALLAGAGTASASTIGAAGAGDPYFPLSGNGGYHVSHYDLTLRYDTSSRHLDGKAVLTARATQKLTRFDLDLCGLKVTRGAVDGRR